MSKFVRFDWAMKKLLTNKANFEILEGLFSELLHKNVTIKSIIEGESNKDSADDKYNRLDLLTIMDDGEPVLIELQIDGQYDYIHRMLCRTSKLLTEYRTAGFQYNQVRKVISINIVYCDFGQGEDYIYKGVTEFKGIHDNDLLKFSTLQQKNMPNICSIFDIYLEYYIVRVNEFNDYAKDSLDEWIYFLKNSEIKPEFNARGLKKAAEELDVMKLSENERKNYESYIDDKRMAGSTEMSSCLEGIEEGEKFP